MQTSAHPSGVSYPGRTPRAAAALAVAGLLLLVAPDAPSAQVTFNNTFSVESDVRLVVDKNRGEKKNQTIHFNWNRNA
ncbi:MAG: hypothetical protein FJ098_09900, partial [Deltaproteobacteria bacterium]|nr:hypothetical protein [Deltaproteobacteria bacterium]